MHCCWPSSSIRSTRPVHRCVAWSCAHASVQTLAKNLCLSFPFRTEFRLLASCARARRRWGLPSPERVRVALASRSSSDLEHCPRMAKHVRTPRQACLSSRVSRFCTPWRRCSRHRERLERRGPSVSGQLFSIPRRGRGAGEGRSLRGRGFSRDLPGLGCGVLWTVNDRGIFLPGNACDISIDRIDIFRTKNIDRSIGQVVGGFDPPYPTSVRR